MQTEDREGSVQERNLYEFWYSRVGPLSGASECTLVADLYDFDFSFSSTPKRSAGVEATRASRVGQGLSRSAGVKALGGHGRA